MPSLIRLRDALRGFFRRGAVESELERELRLHLDLEAEKYRRLGMGPDEARRRARLAFGPVEAVKEAHRDGRGSRWLEELVADTRHALRSLRRNPGFAAAAIVTLALGIGANTAVFSAVHAVILRPLPFADPDRLVMLWEANEERGWVNQTAAPANMLDWREKVRAFDGVGGYASFGSSNTLTGAGEPTQLTGVQVTGDLFRILGVRPYLGEGFSDEDTWRTGELRTVLTWRVWNDVLGADRSIVGRTIMLNSRPVRVVGVLPPGFEIPGVEADLFRPTGWDPEDRAQVSFRRAHWMRVIGRLRDGVTPARANAELQTVVRQLQRDYPGTNTGMEAGFTPLHSFLVGDTRRPLMVLLGAVAVLLLIACANVGNLLLVQAAGRRRETALRLALGARRSRLVRQALTDSLVVSTLGGAAGLVLGWWSLRALGALQPAGLLPSADLSLNGGVLAYVVAISIASGLLFGVAPALWSRGRVPADALREGGRTSSGGARARRWGEMLLVSELALALLLTTGAGLLLRSFWKLQQVDPGIDSRGVLTAQIALPGIRYDSVRKINVFWDELRDRLEAVPGVDRAGVVSWLPLTVTSWSSDFSARGWPADRFGVEIVHREVSPGYFEALRVPLIRGRLIDETDQYGARPVVVINAEVARRWFANEDPVGKEIAFDRAPDENSRWQTIVGVVGSERQAGMARPAEPEVFAPLAQSVSSVAFVVVRGRGEASALAPALRRVVAALDANLAVARVRTMDDVRTASTTRQRFLMVLLLGFAFIGLALAVVGVYGVMSYVVRGRTQELGIRVALGARAAQVRWLVVRRGLGLAALGIGAGVGAAVLATGAMRTMLFDVQPVDPLTFVVVPGLLVLAAVVACWLPAARASRADPMGTLRAE
jgi:putative ABC transport system permease protein